MARRFDVSAYMQVAEQASEKAAAIIMDALGKSRVSYKGKNNIVTEADQNAEHCIISLIRREFPDHSICAEESGNSGTSEVCWFVDPIDGTANYAHGLPLSAISSGVAVQGSIEAGVIHLPALGDKYTARRGKGAWLNGAPLRTSKTAHLSESLLATDFPYSNFKKAKTLSQVNHFIHCSHGIRSLGCAAIGLAMVAQSSVDGFWHTELNSWDYAAGLLLVEEAGGTVTDLNGDKLALGSPGICATNGHIHDEVCEALAQVTSS